MGGGMRKQQIEEDFQIAENTDECKEEND